MNYQGKIIVKNDTVQVSEKFKKREFVIEQSKDVNGAIYTETIKFQAVQTKCELLDSVNIGDNINVSFNIKGNRWEKDGKVSYFNNLDAWKVSVLTEASGEHVVPEPIDESDTELPF